jgi:hypothetical protein
MRRVDVCLQAYANELMQCMLSAFADDPSSEGFQRMEQLVRGHVSDSMPSSLLACLCPEVPLFNSPCHH